MKKITLICPKSSTVISFRMPLIQELLRKKYDVSVIAFDSRAKEIVEKTGARYYVVEDDNRSLNIIKILTLKNRIFKLLKEIKPDVVFTFMLKSNIFGTLAAHKCGVEKIYSMVEGVGDVYINNTLKWKIIRLFVSALYRYSFKFAKKVIFLNEENKSDFIQRRIVKNEQCEIVPGVGVDLQKFEKKELVHTNKALMIARMLYTKGVIEYCKAARELKQLNPEWEFGYLGSEGTITVSDIQEYINDGSIAYYGTTEDVRPYLENCSIFVLPSYREGMSMSIMEAEAVGRAIVTTNVAGCKDAIKNGVNGYLVNPQDYLDLKEKMQELLENKDLLIKMGNDSRNIVETQFDKEIINARILEILK